MNTFAQELSSPYALDTVNNLTQLLMNDGVGIFISDDNLTTVTNVVDGSMGVASDIINNERGIASGDFRVGFDYSARTAQEQANLNADPYQLFRTVEDAVNDYGLKLSSAGETVSLPLVGAFTGTITYTDNSTLAISGSDTYIIDGTIPVSLKSIETTDTAGSQYYDFNRTSGVVVPDLLNGQDGTVAGLPNPWIASSGNIYAYRTPTSVSITAPKITLEGDFDVQFRWRATTSGNSYTQTILSGGDFEWSFWHNWSGRETHYLTCNGTQRTVVEVSPDYGVDYVDDWRWFRITRIGDVLTAYLNSTTTPSNSWTGVSTAPTNFYNIITGNGVKQQELRSFTVVSNGVLIRDYDFTAGTKVIPDKAQGFDAKPSDMFSSGWVPLVDTSTFFPSDYSTFSALNTSESNSVNQVKMVDLVSVGATLSGFDNGLTVQGGGITTTLILATTGNTFLKSLTAQDIDATGAIGGVLIENCEVQNVTG